jgi:exosome complex component MTR3
MPRRPARLANCYVPLVLPPNHNTNQNKSNSNNKNNKTTLGYRRHQREHDELRQVVLETSIIGPALGSSLVELGHTKVLCEVHMVSSSGSNQHHNSNPTMMMMMDQLSSSTTTTNNNNTVKSTGRLHCIVQYAPYIGMNQTSQRAQAVGSLNNNNYNSIGGVSVSSGKMNQQVVMQETGLSHQLTSALLPVVSLEKYPKCTIVIQATILQDSGSCQSAVITAATLALVDAGVELLDLVTSCTVAVMVQQQQQESQSQSLEGNAMDNTTNSNTDGLPVLYLVDPTEDEIMIAQAVICLAMTPNHKEITLWSQSGKLSNDMVSHAMNLCRDGCRTYHKLLREFWIAKFQSSI